MDTVTGVAKAGVGAGATATGAVSGGWGVGTAPAGGIFAGASTAVIVGVGAFMALWAYKLFSLLTGGGGKLPADVQARLDAAIAAGTVRTTVSKSSMRAS